METKDQEINKILEKAENYRKELNKSKFETFKANDLNDDMSLSEIFEEFFEKSNKANLDDKNNVFLTYKLSKEEALNGCEKEIKYKYINEEDKKITRKQKIKFPKNIKDGQNIAIIQNGNYIKELNKYSDLIITVTVR